MKAILNILFIVSYISSYSQVGVAFDNSTYFNLSDGAYLYIDGGSSGDLQLSNSSQIKLDGSISLEGDLTNNATSSFENTATAALFGTLKFVGPNTQTVNGSSVTTLENVTFDNSDATGINLNKSLQVNKIATFTDGVINSTSSNLLQFLSGSSVASVSDASHVNGPVSKAGGTDFDFPIGKGGVYRKAGVYSLSSSETFTAEYFHSFYSHQMVSPLTNVSWVEYWTINRTGTETATVLLSWNPSSLVANGYVNDLLVANYETAAFYSRGGNSFTGDFNNGTLKSNVAQDKFGVFTLGSSSSENILPVELIDYSKVTENNKIEINWVVTNELNLNKYNVYKSFDGINYFYYDNVFYKYSKDIVNTYTYSDIINDKTSYYKIFEEDINGIENYLFTLNSETEKNEGVTILKTKDNIIVKSEEDNIINIEISNINGNIVYKNQIDLSSGSYAVVDLKIYSKGVYLIKYNFKSEKFIIF